MRRFIAPEIKEKAKNLRKNGLSIGQIANTLRVSKSSIDAWVKTMPNSDKYAQLGRDKWIREIQPLGAQGQKRKRDRKIAQIIANVDMEIQKLQLTDELKKCVLTALYWAEGTKVRGMVRFANTDPRLMYLFITLLRQAFVLDERKFRVRLHLHWYHKVRKVRKYWSVLLHIPESQFTKIYRKTRSKEKVFRKNVGGICFLQYNSDALREYIVNYAYAFGEKITGKITAPVA